MITKNTKITPQLIVKSIKEWSRNNKFKEYSSKCFCIRGDKCLIVSEHWGGDVFVETHYIKMVIVNRNDLMKALSRPAKEIYSQSREIFYESKNCLNDYEIPVIQEFCDQMNL